MFLFFPPMSRIFLSSRTNLPHNSFISYYCFSKIVSKAECPHKRVQLYIVLTILVCFFTAPSPPASSAWQQRFRHVEKGSFLFFLFFFLGGLSRWLSDKGPSNKQWGPRKKGEGERRKERQKASLSLSFLPGLGVAAREEGRVIPGSAHLNYLLLVLFNFFF